jgi:hypothetical protein
LRLGAVKEIPSDATPRGIVLGPRLRVRINFEVELWVSKGPE